MIMIAATDATTASAAATNSGLSRILTKGLQIETRLPRRLSPTQNGFKSEVAAAGEGSWLA